MSKQKQSSNVVCKMLKCENCIFQNKPKLCKETRQRNALEVDK